MHACLLGEADLQVRGEVLSGCEGVFPHHHVGDIVDGEAEFRQRCVELIQAGREDIQHNFKTHKYKL